MSFMVTRFNVYILKEKNTKKYDVKMMNFMKNKNKKKYTFLLRHACIEVTHKTIF